MKISILGFNKNELLSISAILGVLGIAMFLNLQIAQRRSRDSQRKSDIKSVYQALEAYHADFGAFPASDNGRIIACAGPRKDDKGVPIPEPCEWGWSELTNILNASSSAYLKRIPSDPQHDGGTRYLYISNSKRFQLFASLEGKDEAEYDPSIEERNLSCGNKICNFGLGYSDTPVDQSLEEYEAYLQSLMEQEKNK